MENFLKFEKCSFLPFHSSRGTASFQILDWISVNVIKKGHKISDIQKFKI